MALTAQLDLTLRSTYTGTNDLATPTYIMSLTRGKTFTTGTGANKVDKIFADTRTLADGANETLDFHDGTLYDPFAVALTLDIVRAIYIYNSSTDATLLIGGAAGTQFPIFSDIASDILKLAPGGELFMTAPGAAGIDVTTNSDLKLAHDGTGTSTLTYDIIVWGED